MWTKTVDAIKRINEIKERREKHFVMERLRMGTKRETHNDVRDVEKNISLIRAPEGIRKKDIEKQQNKDMEVEEEEVEYMDAREMEKKLSAGIMDHQAELMAN